MTCKIVPTPESPLVVKKGYIHKVWNAGSMKCRNHTSEVSKTYMRYHLHIYEASHTYLRYQNNPDEVYWIIPSHQRPKTSMTWLIWEIMTFFTFTFSSIPDYHTLLSGCLDVRSWWSKGVENIQLVLYGEVLNAKKQSMATWLHLKGLAIVLPQDCAQNCTFTID